MAWPRTTEKPGLGVDREHTAVDAAKLGIREGVGFGSARLHLFVSTQLPLRSNTGSRSLETLADLV